MAEVFTEPHIEVQRPAEPFLERHIEQKKTLKMCNTIEVSDKICSFQGCTRNLGIIPQEFDQKAP